MLSKLEMRKEVQRLKRRRRGKSEWINCIEASVICHVSLGTFRDRIMEHVNCRRVGRRLEVQHASVLKYLRDLETKGKKNGVKG